MFQKVTWWTGEMEREGGTAGAKRGKGRGDGERALTFVRGLEVTGKDKLAPALGNPTAPAAPEAILGGYAGRAPGVKSAVKRHSPPTRCGHVS